MLLSPQTIFRIRTAKEIENDISLLIDIRGKTSKPVMVIIPNHSYIPEDTKYIISIIQKLVDARIPTFITLEQGARALKNALGYYRFKNSIGGWKSRSNRPSKICYFVSDWHEIKNMGKRSLVLHAPAQLDWGQKDKSQPLLELYVLWLFYFHLGMGQAKPFHASVVFLKGISVIIGIIWVVFFTIKCCHLSFSLFYSQVELRWYAPLPPGSEGIKTAAINGDFIFGISR